MKTNRVPPAAPAVLLALASALASASVSAQTAQIAQIARTAQITEPATGASAALAQTQAAGSPPAAPLPVPVSPRFDLSVSNAPAAQVYMQLASGTPFNVLVSPEVTGSISVTLKDTTVPEALDTLRELFGYDFRISGNRVFIHSNAVQTRLYRVNYLPGRRQGASDVRVTSSSITGSGGGGSTNNSSASSSGGGGGASISRADDSAHVRTTSDSDFWKEVQASLTAMVGTAGGRGVVLNPSAGVVVVKATPNEQRQVDQYLRAVQLSIERQVMLEAKIVEVSLSKDSQSGINWAAFGRILGDRVAVSAGVAAPGTTLRGRGTIANNDVVSNVGSDLASQSLGRGFYGLTLQASNFAALLNFLQTQGEVSVLSSPRVSTLNNQKAVLKVGSDELFVTGISTTTQSNGTSGSTTTPSLTLQPFFSGIALDVTPQIDDAGNVILHVHPSISVVTEKNKVIDLGTLGQYKLPLASSSISQTDSIVRVKDGQIVAIGGLMTQETRNERSGVPGLQDAPVVGGLFRQTGQVSTKRELVILMKPTIIRDDGPAATTPEPMALPKS